MPFLNRMRNHPHFENIATVSLGYKSLQNNFFYVNNAHHRFIWHREQFLVPILKLNNMNVEKYIQKPTIDLLVVSLSREKD